MTADDFKASVETADRPDSELNDVLKALWYDAKGDWEKAHVLCQSAGNGDGDWVHAYLHRVEGDLPNASYWYSRASQSRFEGSLSEEWESIVAALLNR
ncbi:hypothetical protein [Candidatus Pelagisphaera phototrophica]|uniref:hypothetical protein n=1 Tax=Candidatus Pelagisphaera phototrophica TaxID=2684113 RepID=UPI0019F4522A|nr:hypothetical protein [Candidatus Pelagisphaera phototrophica]QXD33222.1 hypothetical protein GA004_05805 [Candidatus Pelagisphaera phototrophica]